MLIVGGAFGMPGTMLLSADAALRAGAGRVQIATCASIAIAVGIAVPESRVFPMPERSDGAMAPSSARSIIEHGNRADALLIGPGMIDGDAVIRLVQMVVPYITEAAILLDAAALDALGSRRDLLHRCNGRAIITPHDGEMKRILGIEHTLLPEHRAGLARQLAHELRAVVVLKGAETFIAAPDGVLYRNDAGNTGLAVSGSGDTLAGIITGIVARGADPLQAAVWGVHLHARAGELLARRTGPLGYLPREIPAELPALMAKLR